MSTFTERFNEAFEDLLKLEPGLKAAHFAKDIGCERGTISQWRNGRIKEQPTAPLLSKAAKRLWVSLPWLSENQGPKHGNGVSAAAVSAGKEGKRSKEPPQLEEQVMRLADSVREILAAWLDISDDEEREALKCQILQRAAVYRRRRVLRLVKPTKKK